MSLICSALSLDIIYISNPSTIFPRPTSGRGGSTSWHGLNLDAHSGNPEGGPASSAQWFPTCSHNKGTDAEWTVLWGSPHRLGNAHTVGAQTRSGSKDKNYIIQDNKHICTLIYPTSGVQDIQPRECDRNKMYNIPQCINHVQSQKHKYEVL